jgi:hypothetical protein
MTFNPDDYVIAEPEYDFFNIKPKLDDEEEWFCDDEFPADMSSVWRDEKHVPQGARHITQWLRPHQMGASPAMFVDGGSAGDVRQGKLGNCWFISALCILGARQDILDHCIVSMPRNAKTRGKYVFRFFKEGQWVNVTIDDRLPCDENGLPVFGRCSDLNELWVPLFEKAYAKLMGAYGELMCGFINDALVDLTGGVATAIKVAPTNANDLTLWNDLKKKTSSGSYLLGVSNQNGKSETEFGNTGLLAGHAYAIISCSEVFGEKLIKIRNPWSYGEWKGAWSDDAPQWTEEIKKALNVTFGDDGEFYMNYDDFCKNWTNIDCVRVFNDPYENYLAKKRIAAEQGNDFTLEFDSVLSSSLFQRNWNCALRKGAWTRETAGGVFSSNTARSKHNPQFIFHLHEPSNVVVSLMQFDFRYYGDDKDESFPIGFHMLKHKGKYNNQNPHQSDRIFTCDPDTLVLKSKFEYSREVAVDAKLDAGIYVIVPSTYHPDLLSSFTLRVFVENKPFTITAMPSEGDCYSSHIVSGEWIANQNAGGCMNTARWVENPQYVLKANQDMNISLALEQVIDGNTQPTHISYYVAQANALDANAPVFEFVKAQEAPKFTSIAEVASSFSISADKPLVIIPCTFQPDVSRPYKLKLTYRRDLYPDALVQLSSIEGKYNTSIIHSEWKGENAGGCPNDPNSWKLNPKFKFTLKQDGAIQIVLTQEEKEKKLSGVGMHIFNSAHVNGNQIQGEAMWKSKSWNFFKISVASLELKAGSYTVMPSTFYKGEERSFTLKLVAKKSVEASF